MALSARNDSDSKLSFPFSTIGKYINFDFELDGNDMKDIAALTQTNGRLNNQDPGVYEEF